MLVSSEELALIITDRWKISMATGHAVWNHQRNDHSALETVPKTKTGQLWILR